MPATTCAAPCACRPTRKQSGRVFQDIHFCRRLSSSATICSHSRRTGSCFMRTPVLPFPQVLRRKTQHHENVAPNHGPMVCQQDGAVVMRFGEHQWPDIGRFWMCIWQERNTADAHDNIGGDRRNGVVGVCVLDTGKRCGFGPVKMDDACCPRRRLINAMWRGISFVEHHPICLTLRIEHRQSARFEIPKAGIGRRDQETVGKARRQVPRRAGGVASTEERPVPTAKFVTKMLFFQCHQESPLSRELQPWRQARQISFRTVLPAVRVHTGPAPRSLPKPPQSNRRAGPAADQKVDATRDCSAWIERVGCIKTQRGMATAIDKCRLRRSRAGITAPNIFQIKPRLRQSKFCVDRVATLRLSDETIASV